MLLLKNDFHVQAELDDLQRTEFECKHGRRRQGGQQQDKDRILVQITGAVAADAAASALLAPSTL
jgi:hypothetical protein